MTREVIYRSHTPDDYMRVKEWANKNCKSFSSSQIKFDVETMTDPIWHIWFSFHDEKDAVWFKLRWS